MMHARRVLTACLLLALLLPLAVVADGELVDVQVMYEDEHGSVLSEDTLLLPPGLSQVHANAAFVPPGYTLISAPVISVVVTTAGTTNPEFIAFTYRAPGAVPQPIATPAPLPTLQVGAQLSFGRYEQDQQPGNGAEPIQWQVLRVEGQRALLLSVYNLDVRPYHNVNQPVTWESSAMRQWLNGAFLEAAFSAQERASISPTLLSNPANYVTGTYSGGDTQDLVFLLSVPEAEALSKDVLRAPNTAVVNAQGGLNRQGYGTYWLRTAGSYEKNAAIVNPEGAIGYKGFYMRDKSYCVRPALWLDLSQGLP